MRMEKHALGWFESLLYSMALRKQAPISSWDQYEKLINNNFIQYTIERENVWSDNS